jgi:hypothetical protein
MLEHAGSKGPGRPRRVEEEVATERIWAFLTPSERRALGRLADAEGLTVAVLVREAVNAYVADFSDERVFSCTGKSPPTSTLKSA